MGDTMEIPRLIRALMHYRGEFAVISDSARVTIDPGAAAVLHIILGAAIDCVEAAQQDRAALDATTRELVIAQAAIARLEQRADVLAYAKGGGPRPAGGGGVVVDLSEVWARECRDNRPAGPEGGAV